MSIPVLQGYTLLDKLLYSWYGIQYSVLHLLMKFEAKRSHTTEHFQFHSHVTKHEQIGPPRLHVAKDGITQHRCH
jgi:hypothetical protein